MLAVKRVNGRVIRPAGANFVRFYIGLFSKNNQPTETLVLYTASKDQVAMSFSDGVAEYQDEGIFTSSDFAVK